ncbi:FAD-binding and (Fe-S)-binding domain-containing protein [Nocardioides yefusunii]|uniref:FAD-binding and (Fe-S)-binding domain-containing protein n=1 Tax=Nocardioides yefusunii TaxID=2500546 RepID=A0ABW1QZN7_9ACTN|nr:FAD-binding and (Fe-S)-binding domain-containing protein [Nocardioides yefusunii]
MAGLSEHGTPDATSDTDLLAALTAAGLRDVSATDLTRALYAGDASLYRVPPRVVVRPEHTDDLHALVEVSRETGVPLTARGAGTSLAGNAVGPGIVVDTSAHLHKILDLDVETGTAWVEPGVVHASLQAQATAAGWRFGPDPSTHTRCMIGGMIGNNACGSRALGYGRTADNVTALDVVWGTGERARLAGAESTGAVVAALRDVVAGDLAHVRTTFGRFGRQVSGYSLEHLLPERFRPERFLAGTEGTLALVERAHVRLVRDPAVRHLVVLGYPSMAEAADAVPAVLTVPGITACEGLDARIVALVPTAPTLPRGAGWLFVEVAGDELGVVVEQTRRVTEVAGALAHDVVTDARLQGALWRIREDGAGLAARTLARPAHAGWEDAAVPPEKLGVWLREFEALLVAHGLGGVPYGHFGDGCLHVRIDFDFDDGPARFRRFLEECATALAAHGGSLSGEHGDGRARSELLSRMYAPHSLALFGAVKHAADPAGLLNPGVLVDPAPFDADLRVTRPRRSVPGLRMVDDLAAEAHHCTGVGKCVSAHTPGTMCPSWRATRDEKDSTRGRARVLQEALDDGSLLGPDARSALASPAVVDALDLCLSCKACGSECPTGVDMATLKAEVLHQTYAGRFGWLRRPRVHHATGRLPALLGSPLRRLVPLASGQGRLARALRRAAGFEPNRSIPVPAPVSARRAAGTAAAADSRPDVWIWADTFTDHFAPQAVTDTIALLDDLGVRARLLDVSACCALTLVSTGQLDAAARRVDATVAMLLPHVADGTRLLGLEPSCLASLRDDAPRLASDPDAARTVAAATRTLAELLTELDFTPPDRSGTTVVVQPHCHHAAVLGWEKDAALLAATGAHVVTVQGCCGLAGNFGMEAGHGDVSRKVAENHLLPTLRAHPDALVLADGMSCRHQVADLAGRPSVHLVTLLR